MIKKTLIATVSTDAENKIVTFKSDNEEVATVTGAVFDEATGTTRVVVNAISEGTAIITATPANGSKAAE